jgi:hypothetical protein
MSSFQTIACLTVCLAVEGIVLGVGQTPEGFDSDQMQAASQQLGAVTADLQRLEDWSTQADVYSEIVEQFWENNDWNSEPDQFARRMTTEITQIPPWRFAERIEKMTELVKDRYSLTDNQAIRFRSRIFREAIGFMVSNADVIAKQTGEYVEMRVKHEPMTAERIARWTREGDQLITESMRRIETMTRRMKHELPAAQGSLLDKDFEALNRRMEDVEILRERWKQGGWKPQDFGLNPKTHPLLTGQAIPIPPPQGTNSANPASGKPVASVKYPYKPTDETTWARYVREFIRKHNLDPGQRSAIHSILSELEQRASDFRKTHAADQSPPKPGSQRNIHPDEIIESMFAELKSRSEALLTKVQRPPNRLEPSK